MGRGGDLVGFRRGGRAVTDLGELILGWGGGRERVIACGKSGKLKLAVLVFWTFQWCGGIRSWELWA